MAYQSLFANPSSEKKTTLPQAKSGYKPLFAGSGASVKPLLPAPIAPPIPPPETKVNLLNPLAIPKAPEKKIVTTEPFNNSMLRKDYVAPVPVPTLSEQPIKPDAAPKGFVDLAKRTVASTASQVADTAKFGLDYVAKRPAMLLNKLAGVPVLPENSFFANKLDTAVEKKYEQVNQAGLNPVRNVQASVKDFSDKVNVNDPEWERAPLSEKLTTKLPETIYNIAPSIAGSLIPYLAGPQAGFAVSAGSVAEDVKEKALKSGVNPRKAEELGLVTGLAVGYIDKIVPGKQLEGAAKEEFTKGFLKRLAKTSFEEAGTEVAQENIQLAAEATFRDDLGWDEVKTRNAMSALGGLLGGAGINGAVDIAYNGGPGSFSGILDVNTAKPKINAETSPIAALDPAKMPDTLTAEQMQAFQLENAPKAELKPEAMPDTLTAEQVQTYQAEQAMKEPILSTSQGLDLFHGGTSKFGQFDPAKYGSGEGSGIFGNGAYLTDRENVADFYANKAAMRTQIEGYTPTGVFGSEVPFYKKGAEEAANKLKTVNKFIAKGNFYDAKTTSIDTNLQNAIVSSLVKDTGMSLPMAEEEVSRSLDFARKNAATINNFRGELPYILNQLAISDQAEKPFLKSISDHLKGRGFDGIKFDSDKSFEGEGANNYFVFDPSKTLSAAIEAQPQIAPLKETVQVAEPKIELNDSPLHNKIMGELVSAEAGKRIMNGEGLDATFTGSKSTFPQWIPSELRRKPLLDAVSRHITEGTMPTKAAEKRLYQVVYDEMNAQNDVLNDAKFIEQQRQNLFDPFASAEENAAALAKFDEEYAKLKTSQPGIASEGGAEIQRVGQPIQTEVATQETVNQPAAADPVNKNRTLYRGGSGDGASFSTHETIAKDFAKYRGGTVKRYTISNDAKIASYSDFPDAKYGYVNEDVVDRMPNKLSFMENELEIDYSRAAQWAKENGFDAISYPTEGEVRLLNKEKIKEDTAETITEQTKLVPRDEKMESAVFKRLQAEDPNVDGEATYTRKNQAEQTSKAIDLVATDKNKAYRIAMGIDETPNDLTSTVVNIALAEKAREEGNYKLYSELVVKRSLEQTRRGQEIVAEKGSVSDNSLATYTKKLIAARLEKVGEKYTSGIQKQKSRKKSSKSLAMEVIENQVTDLGERINKAKEFNLAEVQSFIDSLAC